jgi:hypothetical protein
MLSVSHLASSDSMIINTSPRNVKNKKKIALNIFGVHVRISHGHLINKGSGPTVRSTAAFVNLNCDQLSKIGINRT